MNATVLTLGLAALLSPPVATDQAPEIVQRSIATHGGEIYEHSETSFDICSKSGCFAVTTRMDGGLYDHTVQEAGSERRRWGHSTNATIEVREFGQPLSIPAGEEGRWRDWIMARVYFALLPFRLEDPSVRYLDLGTTDWSGRPLHRVKVTFEAGSSSDASDEFLYWFDPESARLELFAYTYVNGDGSRGLRMRRLHNHRRVGGLLVFDQENFGREDHSLALEEITPESLDKQLRKVSEIRLERVTVEPLD